jgi:shikimate kinase
MKIFISGISCVGKTTIGEKLANLLNLPFFDFDQEIEKFFGTSIERLQNECRDTKDKRSFREKASEALKHLLSKTESVDSVISLTCAGLMRPYLSIVKKSKGVVIVLTDSPENILDRITFYDIDSRPVDTVLSVSDKKYYLKEIKKDITYFKKSWVKADFIISIDGLTIDESALKIQMILQEHPHPGQ